MTPKAIPPGISRSEEIEFILRQEVSRTKEACYKAHAVFSAVVSEMPLPPPDSDGSARIRDAAIAESVALDELARAVEELNMFIQHGVIPDMAEKRIVRLM